MKNKGPVYNISNGKIAFPLDDHVAIDAEGHISYRIGDHTSYSPFYENNNHVNYWEQNKRTVKPAKPVKPANPSKTAMSLIQTIGVLAVLGVVAELIYCFIK